MACFTGSIKDTSEATRDIRKNLKPLIRKKRTEYIFTCLEPGVGHFYFSRAESIRNAESHRNFSRFCGPLQIRLVVQFILLKQGGIHKPKIGETKKTSFADTIHWIVIKYTQRKPQFRKNSQEPCPTCSLARLTAHCGVPAPCEDRSWPIGFMKLGSLYSIALSKSGPSKCLA